MKLFLVFSQAYHGKPVIKQNYKFVFDAFLWTIHVNTFQRIATDIILVLNTLEINVGSILGIISLPYCNKNGKNSMAAVFSIFYKRFLLTSIEIIN